MTDSNKIDTAKIVSGKLLRRDMMYDARKAHIVIHNSITKEEMDTYAKAAKERFPQDGMYKIEVHEGVAVTIDYLGEY